MRQTVRLANETLKGIRILQKAYEEEFKGLKINQGYVVSKAYIDTDSSSKTGQDWLKIINSELFLDKLSMTNIESTEQSRTTLELSEDVLEGIEKMKKELPEVLEVRWVTIGYCIRLIVKSGLVKLQSENKIK